MSYLAVWSILSKVNVFTLNTICSTNSAIHYNSKRRGRTCWSPQGFQSIDKLLEDAWAQELRRSASAIASVGDCIFDEGAQYTAEDGPRILFGMFFLNCTYVDSDDFLYYKVPKYSAIARKYVAFNTDANPWGHAFRLAESVSFRCTSVLQIQLK